MQGINKVILLGYVGKDPATKVFTNGNKICNVSLATSRQWQDKNTGEQHQLTEWHRVVFNTILTPIAEKYLNKGSKVYIEGKLKTRKWTNQLGQDQYTTEIHAENMQLLDKKPPQHQQMQAPNNE